MEEFPASKVHLQPGLLESFPADVCPDITGQFGCGLRAKFKKFRPSVGGGRGGGRFLIQILSDILDYLFPSNTFLQRTYYFFHISQPAKMCLKNRYFEWQIHWVPLLIDGSWSKALLALLRDETIPSAIRGGNDRLFSVLSVVIIGTHASGISIVLSSDDVISPFGWSILWKFFVEDGISLSCCLSLVRRRGASELLPSPPWITSKRLSYDLQTKRL